MPTDPQHLKGKTDNDLKTAAIISTIPGQLAFFSFLLVLNFIACLFRVFMINFSTLLPFFTHFQERKNTRKIKRFSDLPTVSRLRHVSGNKVIFILRLTKNKIHKISYALAGFDRLCVIIKQDNFVFFLYLKSMSMVYEMTYIYVLLCILFCSIINDAPRVSYVEHIPVTTIFLNIHPLLYVPVRQVCHFFFSLYQTR